MHRYAMHVPIAIAAAVIAGGCAQQYHCYRDGPCCTGYSYCTPAPLPYTPYRGCPTPVASSYVGRVGYAPVAPQASPNEPQTPSDASEPAAPALETASFSREAGPVRQRANSPFLMGLTRIDSIARRSQNAQISQTPLDSPATALKD